mgnify:CR=1 FL=1
MYRETYLCDRSAHRERDQHRGGGACSAHRGGRADDGALYNTQ